MIPAPPQWSKTTGMDPNFFEQGVFNPEGVYPGGGGQQQMKMVGFAPGGSGGGYAPGDPSQYGMQLGQTGGPMFEGKKGLMQCATNPSTGEYQTDAEGNARCWYVPVVAGSGFTKMGGWGTWVDSDRDIVRYQTVPQIAPPMYPQMYNSPLAILKGMGLGIGLVGLTVGIAMFVYHVYITKRVNRGDEPGILAKLIRWDTWKLWGNKYDKQTHKVFHTDDGENLGDYIDADADDEEDEDEDDY